jgi:predicted enzyme related to lactoylglutathione lyase
MTEAIRSLVPLASVSDVERSIRFYARLGFEVRNTFTPEGADAPSWASLESAGATLMLARAEAPLAPNPPVLFYLYCQDVESARREIREAGVEVGPIARPFYAPRGEFRVVDPDGYVLMITHT